MEELEKIQKNSKSKVKNTEDNQPIVETKVSNKESENTEIKTAKEDAQSETKQEVKPESNVKISVSSDEDENINLSYGNTKKVAKGGLLGVFIGLAVIVPGVSGSAIAIIFKMYQNLLYAIGNIFKKFKKCFCYLLPILLGALVGFVAGFFGVRALLNIMPFIIIALFAGLMFGAYPAVTDEIKGTQKSKTNIALFVVGLIIPILISTASIFLNVGQQSLVDLKFYHYIIFLILGYLVAITQLVPGLSATALLMAVGYFTPLMESVSLTNFKQNPSIFLVYICLIIGFAIGLVTVSKGVSALIKKDKTKTFWTISGLSLGSILTMFFNPEVVEVYRGWGTNGNCLRDILIGVVVFAVGILISYWFVNLERKKDKKI